MRVQPVKESRLETKTAAKRSTQLAERVQVCTTHRGRP